MKMIEVNGSMSEELVNGVQSAKSYLDGKTDIAMLSENVFVILDETKASDGVEEVEEVVPEETGEISEEGIDPEAIKIVMEEGNCTRQEAIKALQATKGDSVEALLQLNK